MGMDLIVVAVKNVEAVIFGYTCRVSTSTSPFTEPACRIPLLFEERSDGQLSGSQRRASIIRSDRRVSRMFTRHQIATQRCADRRTRQGVGESQTLSGKLINPRRFDVPVAHVPEFVIGEFVRHDVNDIRRLRFGNVDIKTTQTKHREPQPRGHRPFSGLRIFQGHLGSPQQSPPRRNKVLGGTGEKKAEADTAPGSVALYSNRYSAALTKLPTSRVQN